MDKSKEPLTVAVIDPVDITPGSSSVTITDSGNASNTNATNPSGYASRSLPTLNECLGELNVLPNTSIFYSGAGYYLKVAEAIEGRSYLKGYRLLSKSWRDPSWPDAWQFHPEVMEQNRFWNVCSQALALTTKGTAYVMLPKGNGTEWTKGSTWDRIEWPNFAPDVKVIRIDPDNPECQEVIKEGDSTVE
ncbi:hypothetical protein F4813DRAFT_396199 [Daldinia decipiens]|uniref:uncharacterized protein n=1 Tax=Daldinia decipiens TaxID=326647 RepID=UPI0020C24E37|nr:uncharacterized protein F4813DRAFT_396199 [Daldinia decipiens]KAI1657686.1 hypothetical protein F4813DRAFT_396199 [Daldinia decipiens]